MIRKLETDVISTTISLNPAGPILASCAQIVLRIMDFLPLIECQKMALVCKRFCLCSGHSHTYKHLFRKLGFAGPIYKTYCNMFSEQFRQNNPDALLAGLDLYCDFLFTKNKMLKAWSWIQRLEKIELTKHQQLELMLRKVDFVRYVFRGQTANANETGLQTIKEVSDFRKKTRDEAEQKYGDSRKVLAEISYLNALEKKDIPPCEMAILTQNLCIDKKHRMHLQFNFACQDVSDKKKLETAVTSLKLLSDDPDTPMGIRIHSILRLGMCRAFRFTHAINDQWLINLLASIHNCKWLPLLDQSWAKFLDGVIAFKGQIDGFDDFAFKQWLTDIENPLPTIDSWQLFELIRLYKLINQFNDTSLDSQTVEQFQELIKDLENVL